MGSIHQLLGWCGSLLHGLLYGRLYNGNLLHRGLEEERIWQWKQSRLRRFNPFPDLMPGV